MSHPPITDEMVERQRPRLSRRERAAKAAYETFSGKRHHVAWEKLLTPTRERWRDIASAVLEAALKGKDES